MRVKMYWPGFLKRVLPGKSGVGKSESETDGCGDTTKHEADDSRKRIRITTEAERYSEG
jgi:hypothetical protein